MSEKIREALAKLDIGNDDHWTTEGLPRLDVMKDLVGEPVTRADITAAAKGFSRKTPNLEAEQPENTGSGESADAQATKPETTEDTAQASNETPEADQSEDTVDGADAEAEAVVEHDEGSDEAIEAELESATDALYKAQARHKKATEAMDVVIARRASRAAGRTTAHDIKAYQKSQAEQRARMAQRQRVMTEAMAATKEKF